MVALTIGTRPVVSVPIQFLLIGALFAVGSPPALHALPARGIAFQSRPIAVQVRLPIGIPLSVSAPSPSHAPGGMRVIIDSANTVDAVGGRFAFRNDPSYRNIEARVSLGSGRLSIGGVTRSVPANPASSDTGSVPLELDGTRVNLQQAAVVVSGRDITISWMPPTDLTSAARSPWRDPRSYADVHPHGRYRTDPRQCVALPRDPGAWGTCASPHRARASKRSSRATLPRK
jgi:hypothetical protein